MFSSPSHSAMMPIRLMQIDTESSAASSAAALRSLPISCRLRRSGFEAVFPSGAASPAATAAGALSNPSQLLRAALPKPYRIPISRSQNQILLSMDPRLQRWKERGAFNRNADGFSWQVDVREVFAVLAEFPRRTGPAGGPAKFRQFTLAIAQSVTYI